MGRLEHIWGVEHWVNSQNAKAPDMMPFAMLLGNKAWPSCVKGVESMMKRAGGMTSLSLGNVSEHAAQKYDVLTYPWADSGALRAG